jgi:Flp pilus assembly protein TadB
MVQTIIGLVLAVLVIAMHVAADKEHRAKFGVGLPSKNARKRYRKRARDKGISESEAHQTWASNRLRWEHRQPGFAPPTQSANHDVDTDTLEKVISAGLPQPGLARNERRQWLVVVLLLGIAALIIFGLWMLLFVISVSHEPVVHYQSVGMDSSLQRNPFAVAQSP